MSLEEATQPPPEDLAVGLLPPTAGGGRIRAALLVRLGRAREKAERIMQQLARPGSEVEARSIELRGGGTALELGEAAVAAIRNDLFAIAPDREMLEALLAGPRPANLRLVDTAGFRRAMAPLGEREPGAVYAYLDLQSLLGGRRSADWLRGAKALACEVRPAGNRFRWRVYLHGTEGLEGLTRSLGRDARSLLRRVPQEAVACLALKGQLAGLAGWRPAPTPQVKRILEPLKALGKVGAEPPGEVLASLGDEFLLYLLPTDEKPLLPRFVIQGGGFTADMQRKKTHAPIKNEPPSTTPSAARGESASSASSGSS